MDDFRKQHFLSKAILESESARLDVIDLRDYQCHGVQKAGSARVLGVNQSTFSFFFGGEGWFLKLDILQVNGQRKIGGNYIFGTTRPFNPPPSHQKKKVVGLLVDFKQAMETC